MDDQEGRPARGEVEWEKVRLVYELPDGGTVEVTDTTPVAIGGGDDVYVNRQLTYTNGGCRIVFEVADGVPGCVSITLTAQDRPLRVKDLKSIKLDQIREDAYRAVGMIIPDPEGGCDASARVVRKRLIDNTSRHKITPEFLRRVADIYQSSDRLEDAIEAMKVEFRAGDRQVYRYIAAAKQKGFITEPSAPSAKKASPTKKAGPAKKASAKKAAASGGQHRGKKVLAKKTATSSKPKRKGLPHDW